MPNELWQYLQSRTPTDLGRDVLDVLITYYIFYRVALVLKGTRAMQILIGLALVFVLYVVAQVLRLHTVLTILTAVLSSAILIGVGVFQNDIRRGLMRMGARARLSSGQTLEGKLIDDVVEAAQILARHRTGAIITFEQEANLDEFVGSHQGHVVDAAVTPELLVSLFIPEAMNKLHDGAVIIRDLRIAKAGVFFPMPEGRVADESFGSRHRAAMGITEETDAVVVVVSEERGTISFCFNGNIIANLDGPRLRAALEGVFAPKRKRKKKEKTLLTRLRSLRQPDDVTPASRHAPSRLPKAPEGPPSAPRMTAPSLDPGRPLRDLPRQGEAVPRLPKNAQPLRKRPPKDATQEADTISPSATPNPLRERPSLLPMVDESSLAREAGVANDEAPRSDAGSNSVLAPTPAPAPAPPLAAAPESTRPAGSNRLAPARHSGTPAPEPLPLRHLTKPNAVHTQNPSHPTDPADDTVAGPARAPTEHGSSTNAVDVAGNDPDRITLPTLLHRATPVPEPQEVEPVRGDQ